MFHTQTLRIISHSIQRLEMEMHTKFSSVAALAGNLLQRKTDIKTSSPTNKNNSPVIITKNPHTQRNRIRTHPHTHAALIHSPPHFAARLIRTSLYTPLSPFSSSSPRNRKPPHAPTRQSAANTICPPYSGATSHTISVCCEKYVRRTAECTHPRANHPHSPTQHTSDRDCA